MTEFDYYFSQEHLQQLRDYHKTFGEIYTPDAIKGQAYTEKVKVGEEPKTRKDFKDLIKLNV